MLFMEKRNTSEGWQMALGQILCQAGHMTTNGLLLLLTETIQVTLTSLLLPVLCWKVSENLPNRCQRWMVLQMYKMYLFLECPTSCRWGKFCNLLHSSRWNRTTQGSQQSRRAIQPSKFQSWLKKSGLHIRSCRPIRWSHLSASPVSAIWWDLHCSNRWL